MLRTARRATGADRRRPERLLEGRRILGRELGHEERLRLSWRLLFRGLGWLVLFLTWLILLLGWLVLLLRRRSHLRRGSASGCARGPGLAPGHRLATQERPEKKCR